MADVRGVERHPTIGRHPAGAPTGGLLDEILPRFDFATRHARRVTVAPRFVAAALDAPQEPAALPRLVRVLFRLRGLEVPRGRLRDGFGSSGFSVLAERPGEELVVGVVGRFWAPREAAHLVRMPDAATFRAFTVPGTAKAAMSIRVVPCDDGATRLETETRVACVDRAAYWRFAAYWTIVRPFSGVIRRAMLATLARQAAALARAAAGR